MDSRKQFNMKIIDPVLQEALGVITDAVRGAGGRALLTGGCVRNAALGLPATDLDIEVYGIAPDRLMTILSARFTMDLVGHAFGVLKIHSLPIDISIPRRESKTGVGHGGFETLSDPSMTLEEAASRRDFTMNAMAFDPASGELLDPYFGRRDLDARVLRHTSDKFVEDPLRVLRGMQFVARFDLRAAPETVSLCRSITPEQLARERVFEEWRKLLLLGVRPSRGLTFLRDCGWLPYFPELKALIGCAQEPDWHPEGDVWVHTLNCLDAFASERLGQDWEDLVVGLAVLCHDLGKPATTVAEAGKIRSKGHEAAGEAPTRSFLGRMTNQQDLVEQVIPLVLTHLRPRELYEARAGDSAVRRLALRVGRIDRLVRVARADQMGRPPVVFDGFPAGDWLLARSRALDVERAAPTPIILGRHLLDLGLTPGPRIGVILKACYEAQIDGAYSTLEAGIEYAKRVIREGTSVA